MPKLEGIIKLRGKNVVLEEIENPILKRVLHSRLKRNRFNFWYGDSGYTEIKRDGGSHSEHTDEHQDNYKDYHNDRHEDDFTEYNGNNHADLHTDRGYSETFRQGHSDHTDHY
jgi:hypothetical protein